LTKAAERLRRGDYYWRRLGLHISWVGDLGGHTGAAAALPQVGRTGQGLARCGISAARLNRETWRGQEPHWRQFDRPGSEA